MIAAAPLERLRESQRKLRARIVVDVRVRVLNVEDLLKSARNTHTGRPMSATANMAASVAKRILVAEDSITSRVLLKGILESAGYDVKTAVDGIEGLEIVPETPFPGLGGRGAETHDQARIHQAKLRFELGFWTGAVRRLFVVDIAFLLFSFVSICCSLRSRQRKKPISPEDRGDGPLLLLTGIDATKRTRCAPASCSMSGEDWSCLDRLHRLGMCRGWSRKDRYTRVSAFAPDTLGCRYTCR